MKYFGSLCICVFGLVDYFPRALSTPISDLSIDAVSATCQEYPEIFQAALHQVTDVEVPLSKQAVQKCLQLIEHGKESVHCFPPDAILQALAKNATYLADSLYTHRKDELIKEAGGSKLEEWVGGTKGFLLSLLRGDELLYRQFASINKVEKVSIAEVAGLMNWIMGVHSQASVFLASYLEEQGKWIPDHVLVVMSIVGGSVPILEDLVVGRGLKVTNYSFPLALTFQHLNVAQWLIEKLHLTYENDIYVHSLFEDFLYSADTEHLEWFINQGLISEDYLKVLTYDAVKEYPLNTFQLLLGHWSPQERIHIWTELLDEQEPLLAKVKDGKKASLETIEKFLQLSKVNVEWGKEWWDGLSDKTKNIVTFYLTLKEANHA